MAKLYTTKTPITAADLLNDRVLPFFAEHDMGLIHISRGGTLYSATIRSTPGGGVETAGSHRLQGG